MDGHREESSPIAIDRAVSRYMTLLYEHLLRCEDPNSPILQAFFTFLRKALGSKTLADLVDENNFLEEQLFLFLLRENIIFRLKVQNRPDLLEQFLSALEPKVDAKYFREQRDKLRERLQESTPPLSKTAKPVEDVFEKLKGLESTHMQFKVWVALHHALVELRYEHYVEQRNNRRDLAHALTPVVERMRILTTEDESISPHVHERVKALHRRHSERIEEIDFECARTNLNLEEQKRSTRRVTQLVQEDRDDILQVIGEERKLEIFRRPVETICTEKDDELNATNEKYEALIKALELQIEDLGFDNISAQKEYLNKISELMVTLQDQYGDAFSPQQRREFNSFITKLNNHTNDIDRVQSSDDLQQFLGELARDLSGIIHVLEQSEELELGVEQLQEIRNQLNAIAHDAGQNQSARQQVNQEQSITQEITSLQEQHPMVERSVLLKATLDELTPNTRSLPDSVIHSSSQEEPEVTDETNHHITNKFKNALGQINEAGGKSESEMELIKFDGLLEQLEKAKTSRKDPLLDSDPQVRTVEGLIQAIQAKARNNINPSNEDLHTLKDEVVMLAVAHKKNKAIQKVQDEIGDLISQNQYTSKM